jgi:hypothetical protein
MIGKMTVTVLERYPELGTALVRVEGHMPEIVYLSELASLPTSNPARQTGPVCHYCGMPATALGFFGEPVCAGCR